MTDYDLERSVTDELQWDPKLDSKAVAVSAYDGDVTLRGTSAAFARSAMPKGRLSACTESEA